ncbi:MAG: hypothetical protein JJT87_12505 [Halomonas sp.]|nr:Swt1 family HEPN domain-containing protein [Halomonas sp.]MCC5902731.1 hypothetical protein [Halomonas sp.]
MDEKNKPNKAMLSALKFHGQSRDALEASRRLADSPAMKAVKAFQENSSVNRLLESLERDERLMRIVQGPLEDLRRAGIFDRDSVFQEQLRPVLQRIDAFNSRYTLPDVSTTVRIMQEFQQSPAAEALARYATRADEIQRAMGSMHTPWLDEQQNLRSVTSFVEMQGIGRILEKMPAFDGTVCAALRTDLGDWRDKIDWQELELTDLVAREAFYVGLGFDPSLTNTPAPAFQESTKIAGLQREPPPLVVAYGEPAPRAENDDDEEALICTNRAHDWLQRLESQLRKFIDHRMTEVYGPDWPKHQLPNGVYEQWVKKREAALKSGRQPFPLIAYADFTDYAQVICKKDNWQQVFSRYFVRMENVRESFQRLHPIRVDTMHARPITQDDQLLLFVEVKRLTSVTLI